MKLRVYLQGYLDQYAPGDNARFEYEMADGATIADLVRKLHIPQDVTSVIVVNDEATDASRVLADGDSVTLVPPIGGGASAVPPTSPLAG